MRVRKTKLHPLLLVVLILILLALLLCSVVVGLWLYGRNSLNQSVQTPALPQQDSTPTPESANYIEYNGKRYQYNDDMVNILLMGIDSDENPENAAGNYDQADVLVLAALDLKANKMTLISLSRDIISDIELTDDDGESIGLMQTQLALAYAYGDGQHKSCQLTRNAVSNLFYGLPIQGYAAYYMNGIAELNDAVGGVTVTIIEDFPFSHQKIGKNMIEGHKVTLTGEQAVMYIRFRLEEQVDAHSLRMIRQKQYMLSLVSKAKELVISNPASILTLYDAVDDYILTDLGIGEISYLGTKAAGMNFSGDILNLSGDLIEVNGMAELHVNQESLFALMLDVFYTEI